jgi:hypothetical protein
MLNAQCSMLNAQPARDDRMSARIPQTVHHSRNPSATTAL